MAVLSALPVPGIDFIIGNDIDGGKVRPVLEVLNKPVSCPMADLSKSLPTVFPACMLTQAQLKKLGEEFDLFESRPILLLIALSPNRKYHL